MEYAMKKEHMQRPFVEAGMTDEETGVFPNFDALIGTCKRWVSIKKEIGIKKELKMTPGPTPDMPARKAAKNATNTRKMTFFPFKS